MNAIRANKVVMVVVLVGLAVRCSATEGTWTRKSDMPTARLGLTASTVNGKIYAIGGGDSIDGTAFRAVEEYDPATDTWTRKADMPTQRYFHSASVVNGKVYVIGGAVAEKVMTPTVEEYDPATDTWTTKADMPTARCFFSTSVVNDRVYAIGGRIFPGNFSVSTVEEYDPATDAWTTKADMPAARSMLSTSAVDGKIYAMGGIQDLMIGPGLPTVEEYDPVTDTWTGRADMPTPRKSLSTLVMADRIVAIGGGGEAWRPPSAAFEEYDPPTDSWAIRPDMPTARWSFSASSVDQRIYVIGGSLQDTHDATSTVKIVQEYDLTPTPPDFNGDGTVDIHDLLQLIESWETDDPACDIAPPPFGDGIVDVQDLELLMSYWGQEVIDPALAAWWKLDETDGDIAHDSAGDRDGTVIGVPLWQPAGGVTNGALELDGQTLIVTDPIINPSGGAFSVFAWVKGGAPGQVILSQANIANWLMADASQGKLISEWVSGRGKPLASGVSITDGNWHRVGLTWDGTNKTLYLDDVQVGWDTVVGTGTFEEGLYLGAGKDLALGTYWTGLIDDVRLYDRAVTP